MGPDLWHPDEHSVDFGDVSPSKERTVGYQYQTRRCCQIQEWFGCFPHISPTPASSASVICLRETLTEFELSTAGKLQSWNTSNLELPLCHLSLYGTLMLQTFFKGQAPKLRTLSLSYVLIPWSPIPRGQLTQLLIVNKNENDPALGDSNDFIDLLVNYPALAILKLDFCLPSNLTRFPRDRTIHLLRLSQLCLGGSTSRVTNLLKMLK